MKKAKQRRTGLARIAAFPFNTQGLCKLVFGPDPADKTCVTAGYRLGVDVESTGNWSIIQLAGKLRSCRDCKGRKHEQAAHCESTRNLRQPAAQKCLIAGVPFLFPPSTHRTQYPSLSLFLLHPFGCLQEWFYLTREIEDHTLISLFSSDYLKLFRRNCTHCFTGKVKITLLHKRLRSKHTTKRG